MTNIIETFSFFLLVSAIVICAFFLIAEVIKERITVARLKREYPEFFQLLKERESLKDEYREPIEKLESKIEFLVSKLDFYPADYRKEAESKLEKMRFDYVTLLGKREPYIVRKAEIEQKIKEYRESDPDLEEFF